MLYNRQIINGTFIIHFLFLYFVFIRDIFLTYFSYLLNEILSNLIFINSPVKH